MTTRGPQDEFESLISDLDVRTFVRRWQRSSLQIDKTSRQVGYYSVDGDDKFRHDDSELKYLKMPTDMSRVEFDLNLAYADVVKYTSSNNMDCFLQWILHNSHIMMGERPLRVLKKNFVCGRGVLQQVMCTPYNGKSNGWIICATKFAGNIYLCRFRTEEQKQNDLNMNDWEQLMTSWGYKFEQYMTSDSPTSLAEDPNLPVNERRGFCSVFRTSINDISLLVTAEMDCLRPEFAVQHHQGTISPANYVELKTSRIVDDVRRAKNFHRKIISWWAQSFTVGVPTVMCGFRDDNGIVRHVQEYNTEDLPRIAQGAWNATVCKRFLLKFLDLVTRYVVKDNPRVLYKFEWHPEQKIQCEELEEAGDYRFIPDWYISRIEALLEDK